MRAALLNAAATTDEQAAVVELDQSKVGRLSRMDAMQAQAMAQESVARRDAKLKGIAAALQRLADGDFGWCDECGEAIADARLEIDPTVTLCIGCASALEAG
jgi:DnaK suppressor protein